MSLSIRSRDGSFVCNYLIIIVNIIIIIICQSSGSDCLTSNEGTEIRKRLENTRSSYKSSNIDNKFKDEDEDEDEDEDKNLLSLDEEEESNKFKWIDHNEDHGIYSQRSLMSANGIKSLLNNEKELEESGRDEEDLNALKRVDYFEKEWQLMFRAFDMMYDSMTTSMFFDVGKKTNLFDEILSRLKPACRRDIKHIGNSAKKHKLWALRMVDSNGKLPSGITYGRFASPGDYEECLSIDVNEDIFRKLNHTSSSLSISDSINNVENRKKELIKEHYKFKGKYCLIDFRLPMPEKPKNKLLSVHEPILDLSKTELGREFPEIKNYSAFASVFYEVGYLHGICIPSSCDIDDLTKSIGKSLEGLYVIVNNTIDCEVKFDVRPPLRVSQIISITILTIVFINATLASFVNYYLKEKEGTDYNKMMTSKQSNNHSNDLDLDDDDKKKKIKRSFYLKIKNWFKNTILLNKFYANCFSIQTNFERLTKPDPRGLTFVHYTRIVAMAFTVITHTAAMGTLQAIPKPADASNSEQIFRDFIPQMLANAFTSIQIFFFMAGFMLVVSTYPSIKRERGYLSFIEYATKRAVRLMPGLIATIAINFLWPLFVDGPMLSYFFRMIVVPCEENWYRTLGFLSNFDNVEKMCIRHSYFSASDYQLHLMAFPLLILLYKQPAVSLAIAIILTIAGFVAQVIMILTKTVLPFMMVDYIDKEAFFNVVHYIHHPVWNHMSAFFYGFIIGYLVVKQIRINISAKTIKRIWYILLPIGFGSIFAPYFWNHYKRPIHKWQMVLYVLFDRFALLTTCAWLSYATMVLARPVKRNKNKDKNNEMGTEVGAKNNNKVNLPEIVTIASGELNKEQNNSTSLAGVKVVVVDNNDRELFNNPLQNSSYSMKSLTLIDSIPRQRSSPNIRELQQQTTTTSNLEQQTTMKQGEETINGQQRHLQLHPIRTSYSNVNLTTIDETSCGNEKKPAELVSRDNTGQFGDGGTIIKANYKDKSGEKNIEKKTTVERKSSPVVSNLNTLCLVLSRLTFQLYLFNMVVLWIDVNHSKYFWFFSYYFIITKAFAVYVCAAILAIIFFITLESPSLTVYIIWIKSRAQARAKRQQAKSQLIKAKQETGDNNRSVNNNRESSELNNQTQVGVGPTSRRQQQASAGGFSVQTFDGINMRGCTPMEEQENNKSNSQLGFIDSSLDSSKENGENILLDNQREKTSQQEVGNLSNNKDTKL